MFEASGVSKRYGGVVALTPTDFAVRPGTVHALLGENGAGKSTLVKILTGSVRPNSGRLLIDGSPVTFAHTAAAAASGVAVVSQELSLFPELSVLANLFTMREARRRGLLDRRAMTAQAIPVLAELGLDLDLRRPLGDFSLADRQLIEVGRALLTQPRVLVLDEPTSALESASTEKLLRIVGALRSRGTGVVFVSHILEEVLSVSDEVTVLRDGATVLEHVPRSDLDLSTVVDAMLGAQAAGPAVKVPAPPRATVAAADRPLEYRSVVARGGGPVVDLVLHPGELVGFAGLVGAGHHDMLGIAAGTARASAGEVLLPSGRPVPRTHRAAVAAGVALISGDRRRVGLMLDKPIWENIAQVRSVALRRDGLLVRKRVLRARAQQQTDKLGVKTRSVNGPAGSLSGGNQQKVVFAQWLEAEPQVLLLDDPTRGVDIGAKKEMHRLIRAIADAGAVVLLCSTDNEELADLCHRVVVFYRGAIAGELSGDALTRHALLETMNTGVVRAAA